MRPTSCLAWASVLVGPALGRPTAADAAVAYYDSETGFTFSEFKAAATLNTNVAYRIAVPSSAVANQPYDVVLQIVAPNSVGWAGLSWGSTMLRAPLTIAWANGQQAMFSSRYTTSHSLPPAYTGASYQKLTTGNRSNGTHWQLTVKCTGCSHYTGSGSVVLNPKGSNRLAYAFSPDKPSSPSSNSTSLAGHNVQNYYSYDFTQGSNSNFAELVRKNGGTTTAATSPNGALL